MDQVLVGDQTIRSKEKKIPQVNLKQSFIHKQDSPSFLVRTTLGQSALYNYGPEDIEREVALNHKNLCKDLSPSAPRREANLKGQKNIVPFKSINQTTYFKTI